jgi:SAM-dependent methyltransferase
MGNQDSFLTCYRGNQSAFRHAAYMRMSKVLLIQHVLDRLGVDLKEKSLFDYGFGAGTFFRYCPRSSRLFGVELDPVVVDEVARMLTERGYRTLCLQPIRIDQWMDHPLLARKYDLIICSHVIEHLEDPAGFLRRMGNCLESGGLLLGLVPIHERKQDPHHVRQITASNFEELLEGTGLQMIHWEETDAWLYWLQPLFTCERGMRHKLAQALSFALGAMAMACGYKWWFRFSTVFSLISFSKPTQAAFVLRSC